MEAVIKPNVSIAHKRSFEQNFELLIEFVKKDLKTKYKNIFLGIFWTVLQPLILALIFTKFRNVVSRNHTNYDLDYAAMYIIFITWYFFTTSIFRGANSISSNYRLINAHKFPIILFPISTVLSSFFDVFVNLFTYTIFLFIFKDSIVFNVIFLFFNLAIASVFIIGLCILFSLLQCFFQETNQIVLFINKISLFALPILYNSSLIPENIRWIYEYIPVVWMINKTKDLVSRTSDFIFNYNDFIILIIGIFTFLLAYIAYKTFEDIIIDHL